MREGYAGEKKAKNKGDVTYANKVTKHVLYYMVGCL